MGQHTWFKKKASVEDEVNTLYNQLDKLEEAYQTFSDEYKILQNKADKLDDENNVEGFHDTFRTNKRNEDGTYTDETIRSQKECFIWLKNNNITITKEQSKALNEFWKLYPDGIITFD